MKTRGKIAFATALTVALVCVVAGEQETSKDVQLREMKKLDWWVGHWKGSGWIQMGPQGRQDFNQTENIEAKLDGMVLVVEGQGKAKQGGATVHSALAFVSYDPHTSKFRWHSFTPHGQIDTEAKVGQDSLQWSLEIPGRGQMRYTITRNDKGEWFEIGEMSQEDQTWRKFFEMTLTKEK